MQEQNDLIKKQKRSDKYFSAKARSLSLLGMQPVEEEDGGMSEGSGDDQQLKKFLLISLPFTLRLCPHILVSPTSGNIFPVSTQSRPVSILFGFLSTLKDSSCDNAALPQYCIATIDYVFEMELEFDINKSFPRTTKTALGKDIIKLEWGQKRFTRVLPGMEGLSYKERLDRLRPFLLERRRLRCDLLEIYKIMRSTDKVNGQSLFPKLRDFKTPGGRFL
eukprot:g42064.t1